MKIALFLEHRNFNPERAAKIADIGNYLVHRRFCTLLLNALDWQCTSNVLRDITTEGRRLCSIYVPDISFSSPLFFSIDPESIDLVDCSGRWESAHQNPFIRKVHIVQRSMIMDCDSVLLWRLTGSSPDGERPGFLSYIRDWSYVLGKPVVEFDPASDTHSQLKEKLNV